MDGDLIQSHEDDEPMNANEEKVLLDESEGEGAGRKRLSDSSLSTNPHTDWTSSRKEIPQGA